MAAMDVEEAKDTDIQDKTAYIHLSVLLISVFLRHLDFSALEQTVSLHLAVSLMEHLWALMYGRQVLLRDLLTEKK